MSTPNSRAAAYLEKYQQAYAAITGLLQRVPQERIADFYDDLLKDKDFLDQILKKEGVDATEFRARFIQPYLSETDYLTRVAADLLTFNNLQHIAVPAGVLPTMDFNASLVKSDEGERIVVLNSGIVAYMSQVINSFLATFTTPISKPIWRTEEAQINIIQWTIAVNTGKASLGLNKVPSFRNASLIGASGNLGDTARVFILAHEYAHLLLNHTSENATKIKNIVPGVPGFSIEYYIKKQEQEYEADQKGVALCIEWCKATHNGAYQVVFLAVILTYHLLRLQEVLTPVENDELTHPESILRRRQFEKNYGYMFDEQIKFEIRALDHFMEGVYRHADAVKKLLKD